MPSLSREPILERLRAATSPPSGPLPDSGFLARRPWSPFERLTRLRRMMEAVRTEFLEATPATWPAALQEFLLGAGVRTFLYGRGTWAAAALESHWETTGPPPAHVAWTLPVEEMKETLFRGIDAGLTTCAGAVADTGSLVLVPSPAEPRLLSLVPPIHVVLLDTAQIHDTFWHAATELGWPSGMPRNALLVSGPSKTADIEQTLAYGVHGPRRLVVLLVPSAISKKELRRRP